MNHLPLRRLVPGSIGALLLAASLTACGGDSGGDAPEDASQEEFCEAFTAEPGGENPSTDEVHDYADELRDVGTPESIEGEAREGFEIYVDALADIDDDDLKAVEDGEDPGDIVDGGDRDKVTAFFESDALTECVTGGTSEDLESELDDLESDLPTDQPS